MRTAPIPAFVGIDVAFGKNKRLPVVICTWQAGCLRPQPLRQLSLRPPVGRGNIGALDEREVESFAQEAAEYVVKVCSHLGLVPARIAIDAPSEPCLAGTNRRAAECALDASRISCFATPTAQAFDRIRLLAREHLAAGGSEARMPHANQLWMLAGFALFRTMRAIAPCLEVFPQATVRVLGAGAVHKGRAGAVLDQLRAASSYTRWPSAADTEALRDVCWGGAHDRLDAYLSAWVAALEQDDRRYFGKLPTDAIWIPRLDARAEGQPQEARPSSPRPVAPTRSDSPSGRARVRRQDELRCPGCGVHVFKRWPMGWDAHAAHVCPALDAETPAARRQEYRRRFADQFKRAVP